MMPEKSAVQWKPFVGLLTLALLVRLAMVPFRNCAFWADEPRYLTEAYNLHAYGVISFFRTPHPLPTAMDTPLFILLLSGLIGVCGTMKAALQALACLNAFFFIVAAAGVYRLAFSLRRDRTTALAAMAFFLFFPETFAYVVQWMPDAMFLMLLAWALAFFADYLGTHHWQPLAAASVLWAASVLTKPVSLYFGPLLLVAAVLIAFREPRRPWRNAIVAATAAASGILLFCPWIARNYHDFHLFGITSIVDSNPYFWNYPVLLEATGAKDPGATIAAGIERVHQENPASRTNEMLESRLLGQIARKELTAHLGEYLVVTLRRHPVLYLRTGVSVTYRYFYSGDPVSESEFSQGPMAWYIPGMTPVAWQSMSWVWKIIQAFSSLFLAGVDLFACAGFIRLAGNRDWKPLLLLGVVFLYFAVAIGPLVDTRYRLPMLSSLSVAAAIGCTSLRKRGSRSISRQGLPKNLFKNMKF